MSKKDPHIEETIEKLIELSRSYEGALKCANEIISMKNRMIELCEQETALYKKEVSRLHRSMFWLSVCLGAISVGSLLSYIL